MGKEELPGREIRIGIIGTGFVARGLTLLIREDARYTVSKVLTRRPVDGRENYSLAVEGSQLTNSVDELIENSELVIECSGDPVYVTEPLARILDAGLPVVTMDAELHVTTGSWLARRGHITEAVGDQPGSLALLREEALEMGFKPLVLGNIKGFLNHNPTLEDMEYWSRRNGISLTQVTSFTDGTKLQVEQALVANGLGATIAKDGLNGFECVELADGARRLAEIADKIQAPISDYVLSPTSPPGVFIVATHHPDQASYLKYYKLGEGPYYILVRPFHLCHLELLSTVKRTLRGDDPLLNNSLTPQISVTTIAKRELKAGEVLPRGIGSFDVRGEAVKIVDHPDHVPIGLLSGAVVRRNIEPGEEITFGDVDLPDSLALEAWRAIRKEVLNRGKDIADLAAD